MLEGIYVILMAILDGNFFFSVNSQAHVLKVEVTIEIYNRINFTKPSASAAGNIIELRLKSQVKRVREVK